MRFFPKKRTKTPTVLQMEEVECGAASLGIVLAYYGKIIPLEELRIACGISRDGSKASNLIKAAKNYGLNAKGYRIEPEELALQTFPLIAFWNFNHFLVIEGVYQDTVYLNDPASGPRTVSLDEFNTSFTGVILTFDKSDTFKKSGKRKKILPRLYAWLKGSEKSLIYIIIATLALTIPGLLVPIFTQIFVDDVLVKHLPGWLGPLLMGMLVTAILRGILTYLQQNQLLKLQAKLTLIHSAKFFWHVLKLPLVFYQQRFAGDIAQRVNANETVSALLTGEIAVNAVSIITLIFYALLMFWYSPLLTVIGIFFAGLNFFVLRLVGKRRKDQNYKLLQDRAKLMGMTLNGLSIIDTIKATGSENDFFIRWSGYNARVINSEQSLEFYTRLLSIMPSLFSGLMMVIILGVGGYEIIHANLTIGMLVAFQSLMVSFSTPIGNLVTLGTSLQNLEADLARLEDVEHASPDPLLLSREITKETITTAKLAGYLELRNVTFGYSRLEPPLIENFSLTVKPGSRVALIGGTGSGKTTIIRLVSGILEPWSGEILFDGKQRKEIPRALMNNSLSSVDQDVFLFDDSVRNNLTMWDETLPESDMIEGAKAALIHDVIVSRQKGYDSYIGEQGGNYSGGERQRLEIARALTIRPTLLLMDEATASLDPLTEKIIDDNIRKLGCTCLIVAHRLSTIRDCDEIIVMDRGKISQRGTHNTLVKEKGRYAELIALEEHQ